MGNYKYIMKLGLSEYCVPKIMNIGSGFFKLWKIKLGTFLGHGVVRRIK